MLNKKLFNKFSGNSGPQLKLIVPENTYFTVNGTNYYKNASISIEPGTIVDIVSNTDETRAVKWILLKEDLEKNWIIKEVPYYVTEALTTKIVMPFNDVYCTSEVYDFPDIVPVSEEYNFPLDISISFIPEESGDNVGIFLLADRYNENNGNFIFKYGKDLKILVNNKEIESDSFFVRAPDISGEIFNIYTYSNTLHSSIMIDYNNFYKLASKVDSIDLNPCYFHFVEFLREVNDTDKYCYTYNSDHLSSLKFKYNNQEINSDILKTEIINHLKSETKIEFTLTVDKAYIKSLIRQRIIADDSILCDWLYTTSPFIDSYNSEINRDLLINAYDYGYTLSYNPHYLYNEWLYSYDVDGDFRRKTITFYGNEESFNYNTDSGYIFQDGFEYASNFTDAFINWSGDWVSCVTYAFMGSHDSSYCYNSPYEIEYNNDKNIYIKKDAYWEDWWTGITSYHNYGFAGGICKRESFLMILFNPDSFQNLYYNDITSDPIQYDTSIYDRSYGYIGYRLSKSGYYYIEYNEIPTIDSVVPVTTNISDISIENNYIKFYYDISNNFSGAIST